MAAVKSLVAFMGLLILIGLGLLGYGMMRVSNGISPQETSETPVFGAIGLNQPAGSRLRAVIPDGTGRLLLTISGGDRPDRVVLVDPGSGTVLGTITLEPESGS